MLSYDSEIWPFVEVLLQMVSQKKLGAFYLISTASVVMPTHWLISNYKLKNEWFSETLENE